MNEYKVSVVIRTLNEGQFLDQVLQAIGEQQYDAVQCKTIVVDSGSTDDTLTIAECRGAKIVHIEPADFSFGGALNLGFEHSHDADVVVTLSGHCIPTSDKWLEKLVEPIRSGKAELSFGKQSAPDFVRTSERNYFYAKYRYLERGYVCGENFNNGNSALKTSVWVKYRYNDTLKAQEDIEFAVRVVREGNRVFYEPSAEVTHVHDDTNRKVYKRLVREIYTELCLDVKSRHEVIIDILRTPLLIYRDSVCAYQRCKLVQAFKGIVGFRAMQMAASLVALYRSCM